MSRTAILGFIAFVTAVTVGAFLAQKYTIGGEASSEMPPPSPRIASTQVDLVALQEAATESCMCERRGGSEEECNAAYASARQALLFKIYGTSQFDEMAASATACAPVSTEIDCFEFTDGERCITTGFSVNGASNDVENRRVCTVNEARAIERAYEDGWLGEDGVEPDPNDEEEWRVANERATGAVDDMLRRILAGEPTPPREPSGGCAG
ncbi:hypothetical protein FIU90_12580 [Erythrobacter sp. THAF29]|nr:hypothetical protein FIU90_12580 [Erythrobacter sp. THAF29]